MEERKKKIEGIEGEEIFIVDDDLAFEGLEEKEMEKTDGEKGQAQNGENITQSAQNEAESDENGQGESVIPIEGINADVEVETEVGDTGIAGFEEDKEESKGKDESGLDLDGDGDGFGELESVGIESVELESEETEIKSVTEDGKERNFESENKGEDKVAVEGVESDFSPDDLALFDEDGEEGKETSKEINDKSAGKGTKDEDKLIDSSAILPDDVSVGEEKVDKANEEESESQKGGLFSFFKRKKKSDEKGEEEGKEKAKRPLTLKKEMGIEEEAEGEGESAKKGLNKKWILIGSSGVVVLLLGIGVAGLLIGGNKESNNYAPVVAKRPAYLPPPPPPSRQRLKARTGQLPQRPQVERKQGHKQVKVAQAQSGQTGQSQGQRIPKEAIQLAKSEAKKEVVKTESKSIVGQNAGHTVGHTGKTGQMGQTGRIAQRVGQMAGQVNQAGRVEEGKGVESEESGISVVVGKDKNIALLKKDIELEKLLAKKKEIELKLKELTLKEQELDRQLNAKVIDNDEIKRTIAELQSQIDEFRSELESLRKQQNSKEDLAIKAPVQPIKVKVESKKPVVANVKLPPLQVIGISCEGNDCSALVKLGVKTIRLSKGDFLLGFEIVNVDKDSVYLQKGGVIKRIPVSGLQYLAEAVK